MSRSIRKMCEQKGLSSIVVEQHPVLALRMTHKAVVFERGTVVHAGSEVPLFHIADAVIPNPQRQGMQGQPVGVLGTPATLACGLYQKALDNAGHPVLVLENS